MPSITLQLINNGPVQYQNIGLACHVKKPLEQFLFKKRLNEGAVALDYYENEKINAKENVFIFDRSHLLYRDTALLDNTKFKVFSGTSITTQYKDILITDKTGISSQGQEIPLFYKHVLDEDTVEVDIKISSNMDVDLPFIYKVEIERNAIYTNASNFFNSKTGRYKIVFINETKSDGSSVNKLLSIEPCLSEATWEDVDPATGQILNPDQKYTKEETSSGYKYYFNGSEKYFWTPRKTNLLNIKEILGVETNENWFPVVSNGVAYRNVNGTGYRYYVSEYSSQNFFPTKPYSNSVQKVMQFVNSNILYANLNKIKIGSALPVEIFVYDEDGILIDIFTNNSSKADTFFDGIPYTVDAIEGYDSETGLIYLNRNLNSNYTYKGNVFYIKEDLELKSLNVNPVLNPQNRHNKFVIYCIPNTSIWEKSIHYLIVNEDDKIIECSQNTGDTYGSLQEDINGIRNPDSVIGKNFSLGENSFNSSYSFFNRANPHQYMILGEMYLTLGRMPEDSFYFPLDRDKEYFKNKKEVFRQNRNTLQSKYGYGENGQNYAENKIAIVEIPIEFLTTYGGDLEITEVPKYLDYFSQSSLNKIIKYVYPEVKVNYIGDSQNIIFDFEWPGPDTSIEIWKKQNGEFLKIHELTFSSEANQSWSDTNQTTNVLNIYKFRTVKGQIEYPYSDEYEVLVK